MTFDEQLDEQYRGLDKWIKVLENNPTMIGYQSGNESLAMMIRIDTFYTGYKVSDLTKALPVMEFKHKRQIEIQSGERFNYWFDRKLTIEEIIDNM